MEVKIHQVRSFRRPLSFLQNPLEKGFDFFPFTNIFLITSTVIVLLNFFFHVSRQDVEFFSYWPDVIN